MSRFLAINIERKIGQLTVRRTSSFITMFLLLFYKYRTAVQFNQKTIRHFVLCYKFLSEEEIQWLHWYVHVWLFDITPTYSNHQLRNSEKRHWYCDNHWFWNLLSTCCFDSTPFSDSTSSASITFCYGLNTISIRFLCQGRPGPGCSKYWIKLFTGQLLIQWTASQWIKLVVQKQRQWLARYPLDKILSSGQLP